MSAHSTYELLRHLADSWGLLAMMITFAAFVAWAFRPGARTHNDEAAQAILKDDEDGDL